MNYSRSYGMQQCTLAAALEKVAVDSTCQSNQSCSVAAQSYSKHHIPQLERHLVSCSSDVLCFPASGGLQRVSRQLSDKAC